MRPANEGERDRYWIGVRQSPMGRSAFGWDCQAGAAVSVMTGTSII